MATPPARKSFSIRWQPNMKGVLLGLVPVAAAAVFFYGWRAVAVLMVTNGFAFATEYGFTRQRGEPVTSAVFVTGSLLALSLPPSIPLWMCAVGAIVGVAFGKELFGGMGRNVFNPALVGRAFLYVCFPLAMTAGWVAPFPPGAGGLTHWISVDAVGTATPLPALLSGTGPGWYDLLLGAIPGSLGEGCKPAVMIGGLYLLWKKWASWEIVAATLGSFFAAAGAFWLAGHGPSPLQAVLAGGVLYGTFFMATDPVSANRSSSGKVAYGCLIGLVTVLIRNLGNFPEGTMFAILLGNTFGPIMEEGVSAWKKRKVGGAAA